MQIAIGDLSKFDAERAILPTILYARKDSGQFTARSVAVGWWKWGVRFSHVWAKPTPPVEKGKP